MKKNYAEQTLENVVNYITENINIEDYRGRREDLEEKMNDECWIADEITGNASGSYTFNRSAAREYVFADMETVIEAYREFAEPGSLENDLYNENYELIDVTARCYCLSGAIYEALEALEEAGAFDEAEENNNDIA